MALDLNSIHRSMSDDIDAVSEWCETLYQDNFGNHFVDARVLFDRLQSKEHPITDDELSWILLDLPIDLFDVSEVLNRFRLNFEVVKMRIKQKESEIAKNSSEPTAAKRNAEAAMLTIEDKILMSAYSSVISRVESEITFCKELIMGAKKIWDGRRKTESVNPVAPVEDELPEYKNQYIKGV